MIAKISESVLEDFLSSLPLYPKMENNSNFLKKCPPPELFINKMHYSIKKFLNRPLTEKDKHPSSSLYMSDGKLGYHFISTDRILLSYSCISYYGKERDKIIDYIVCYAFDEERQKFSYYGSTGLDSPKDGAKYVFIGSKLPRFKLNKFINQIYERRKDL